MKSWKEAKFGKPHRNIKTDITAVRRLFGTYCERLGMDEKTAFVQQKLMDWALQECSSTCGSVCGMMMLAGLKNSDANMESPASKFATFDLGKEMAKRFEQRNTSMICNDLRGTDGKTDRLRSCRGCVMDCAQIVEEVLFPGEFEPYDGPSEL